MDTTKKNDKKALIYLGLAVMAHSELRTIVFNPWLITLNTPFWLYKHLFTLSFLGLYGVPFFMILDGKTLIQWRIIIMKTNFWGWFALIACSIAFLVLIAEVSKCLDSLGQMIRVVIAASVIFIPNMWAFTYLIGENSGRKNGDNKPEC